MEKKELKFYEAPMTEVVGLKASVALLAGSSNAQGIHTENDDDGFVDDEE